MTTTLRTSRSKTPINTNLELVGERFIRRVSHAMRKETWGRTITQLAWTAGPVTYLALRGGYFFGYGQAPPHNLIIYFAGYTIIAGVFAVIMRFLYNFTRGQAFEEAQHALTYTLDKLPDLILMVRNHSLQYYDEEKRMVLASKYMFENPDAVPETVGIAVDNITGDKVLAEAIKKIETYRRNSLYTLLRIERERVESRFTKAKESIAQMSPALSILFENRFNGKAPSKRSGRARVEGFIQRVLTAGEEGNYDLMTLQDAEEMFILAYELLADRSIPMLSLKYSGNSRFTETSVALDNARMAFRKAAYYRNSRLRLLAELFIDSDHTDIVPAASPFLITTDSLYDTVRSAIEELYRTVRKKTGGIVRKRRIDGPFREELDKLETAISLHRSLQQANSVVEKRYAALKQAEKNYYRTMEQDAKKFPPVLLRENERGRGIKIIEKQLFLSQKSKLSVSRRMYRLIESIETGEEGNLIVYQPYSSFTREFNDEDFKNVAFEIAMIVEKEIKLSRFEVQYAIESSNAPYLTALEVGLTTATKTGWALSLVREVQKNMKKAVHRIAQVLVDYHGVPFDEHSIDFLTERYGADREIVEQMNPEGRAINYSLPYLNPPQLLHIPPLDTKYGELSRSYTTGEE